MHLDYLSESTFRNESLCKSEAAPFLYEFPLPSDFPKGRLGGLQVNAGFLANLLQQICRLVQSASTRSSARGITGSALAGQRRFGARG